MEIDQLLELRPRYWAGPPQHELLSTLPGAALDCWTLWTPDLEVPDRRFALACLALNSLDASTGQMLGRLRDLFAELVVVFVPSGTDLTAELRALGFERLGLWNSAPQRAWQLFCHDIAHYKKTPDWFGPRDWANPELWDKHRW